MTKIKNIAPDNSVEQTPKTLLKTKLEKFTRLQELEKHHSTIEKHLAHLTEVSKEPEDPNEGQFSIIELRNSESHHSERYQIKNPQLVKDICELLKEKFTLKKFEIEKEFTSIEF